MKRFTMPSQPDVCLDDLKTAMEAFAREHSYAEEAGRSELNGIVSTTENIQNEATSAKKTEAGKANDSTA